jgi:hypothetical protein
MSPILFFYSLRVRSQFVKSFDISSYPHSRFFASPRYPCIPESCWIYRHCPCTREAEEVAELQSSDRFDLARLARISTTVCSLQWEMMS